LHPFEEGSVRVVAEPEHGAESRLGTESEHENVTGTPGPGLSEMPFDDTLNGRRETRQPIVVAVRLARPETARANAGGGAEERTYTDNISPHGARIYSVRPWERGDAVRVTPRNEYPTYGEVVYCQALEDGRFAIGVRFQERFVTSSATRGADRAESKPLAKATSG